MSYIYDSFTKIIANLIISEKWNAFVVEREGIHENSVELNQKSYKNNRIHDFFVELWYITKHVVKEKGDVI